jgi:hypothetical protein
MVTRLCEAYNKPCTQVTHDVWLEATGETEVDLLVDTYEKIIKGEYGHKMPSTAEFMDYYREIRKRRQDKLKAISSGPKKKSPQNKEAVKSLLAKLQEEAAEAKARGKEYKKSLPHYGVENGRTFSMTEDDMGRSYVRWH